jgi:hypothetical protein
MALNTNAPYSGEVEYGRVAGDEPGVAVNGGSLTIDPQVGYTDGIGMQRASHRSHYTGVVSYDVVYPVKALLSGMLRASASNSVAAVACIAGTQDGEWTLSSCQPSGFTARCAVGEPLSVNLGYWGLPTQTATGAAQGAPSTNVDVDACGFSVAVDTVDYFVQSWDVSLNTNPGWWVAQNHTTSDSAPDGVLLGVQEVTLRLSCAKQIPDTVAKFTPDEHDEDIDVTIIGVNPSNAAQITFTLSELCTPTETVSHTVGGLKVWDYEFTAAKQLGVLTVT